MLSCVPDVASHQHLHFHLRGGRNPSGERLHQEHFQPSECCQILGFLPQNQSHNVSLRVFSTRSAVSSGDPPTSNLHQCALPSVRNRSSARLPGEKPQKL